MLSLVCAGGCIVWLPSPEVTVLAGDNGLAAVGCDPTGLRVIWQSESCGIGGAVG